MLTIIEITRGSRSKTKAWKVAIRYFCASMILCGCLIKPLFAANNFGNNDFRSMPFIEMMVAMMKVMNQMMGNNNNNYVPGLGALPYSPGMTMLPGIASGLGGFNNFPMSPTNGIPMSNFMSNGQNSGLSDNFQTGKNAQNFNTMNDFWNPQKSTQNNSKASNFPGSNSMGYNKYNPNSVNGIWQSLSGDVLAIYNNSYFMWTDGKTRKLVGRLFIKGNNLVAYFPVTKKKLFFQFYKESGQFIVRDQTSRIYTFKRLH